MESAASYLIRERDIAMKGDWGWMTHQDHLHMIYLFATCSNPRGWSATVSYCICLMKVRGRDCKREELQEVSGGFQDSPGLFVRDWSLQFVSNFTQLVDQMESLWIKNTLYIDREWKIHWCLMTHRDCFLAIDRFTSHPTPLGWFATVLYCTGVLKVRRVFREIWIEWKDKEMGVWVEGMGSKRDWPGYKTHQDYLSAIDPFNSFPTSPSWLTKWNHREL